MSDAILQYGLISEETIQQALVMAKGDLFVASAFLNIRPSQLDSHLRTSNTLRAFVLSLERVKTDPEYKKYSSEQFKEKLEEMSLAYKIDATEEIYKLAMMPVDDSAAMAEVKLKAAKELRGDASQSQGTGLSGILSELNEEYQKAAPRIKSIRVAAQIEYQEGDDENACIG